MGFGAVDAAGHATSWYAFHIALAIAAGMLTVAVHVATYTYFMATSRWIQAAGDKGNLPAAEFTAPAFGNKKKVIVPVMTAIAAIMIAMFAGAAADPTMIPWLSGQVHLVIAATAIAINVICALAEFRLIRRQGAIMDRALAILNNTPGVIVQHG